ncbi:phosphate ABC transporter substrate-binding protein PstS [Microcella sp.]|uniref:phosphate ABC transporter substrate-binding protein PstS n=1 Tax=Microcella sp. TaxID=1913979 RepID=UPI00391D7274
MTHTRAVGIVSIALSVSLVMAGCAVNEQIGPGASDSRITGTLVGAGSSALGAAQNSWIAGFQTAHPRANVTYDPTGSGAGREAFAGGGTDFAGTDRAFSTEELDGAVEFRGCAVDSGVVQLPLYISPIAVIFRLEGIDSLNMSADVIAGIFAERITDWSDPAIAELNPETTLPELAITPVHRSDDSGTTENFTDYLAQAAPTVWSFEADGVWPLDSGEAAQGTSGVVDAVSNGVGTIGYADASRAGDLGIVSVGVGDEFVPYSPEAAAAIVDASPTVEGRPDFDLSLELDRDTTASGVYPIVLVSYLVACERYTDPVKAELVAEYFRYMASTEGQLVAQDGAGSAPISDALFLRVSAAIEAIS